MSFPRPLLPFRLRGAFCASRVALLAVLVLQPALASRAAEGDLLELALRSPAEREGDYDRAVRGWLEAIALHGPDFKSELLVRRIAGARELVTDEPSLIPLYEKALANQELSGVVRQVLIDQLGAVYRLLGREEDRQKLSSDRGYLLHWHVIGPFGKNLRVPALEAFAPESSIDLGAPLRDGYQELRWHRIERERPEPPVRPFDFIAPQNGIAYLLSQVKAEEESDLALQRFGKDRLRVWVNGALVVDDDPLTVRTENRRATPVRLAKGWNRILVKARDEFWIRLARPDGHAPAPGLLTEEMASVLHPIAEGARPAQASFPVQTNSLATWRKWVSEIDPGTEPPQERRREIVDARLGLAILEAFYDRDDLAMAQVDRALELLPEDAWTQFHAGDIIHQAGYLPRTVNKDRALKAFEAAHERDKDLLPAYQRIAQYLADDEKPARAALKLREALEKKPDFLLGLSALSGLLGQKGWTAEQVEIERQIEAKFPRAALVRDFWVDFQSERHDLAGAIARQEAAVKALPGAPRAYFRLAHLLGRAGRQAAAEAACRKALELAPDEAWASEALVKVLADQGRFPEALELARSGLARNPQSTRPLKKLAEIQEKAGDSAAALATLRKIRELDPGDVEVRRAVALEEGSSAREAAGASRDAFWAPYDEKLEDWTAKVPTEGPLVEKAASISMLDIMVTRYEIDGSATSYVHVAAKLLSEESKDDLANVRTPGEILLLRTFTPAGESLEPVPGQGEHSWVMPGMARGAIVEHAYLDHEANRHGASLAGGSFYFQDLRFRQSFLLSRYVILAPRELELNLLETNLDEGAPERQGSAEFARVTKTVKDLPQGMREIVIEARNVPRLEREQFMPTADEYIPNVTPRDRKTWNDVANEQRERFRGRAQVYPEIERATREVIKGLEDPLERARAIYSFVQKTIPTEGSTFLAIQVLLEKSGDRDLLLKAMFDVAGVPSSWAVLRPREEFLPRTDWNFPGSSFFFDPYIQLDLPGKAPIYVSLDDRQNPFGRIPEHLEGGKALHLTPGGHEIVPVPPGKPEDSAAILKAAFRLLEGVDVDCDIEFSMLSVAAYAQKEQLKNLPAFQKDLALRQFANQLFRGAKIKASEMKNLEDPDKPFALSASLTAPKLLQKSKDDYLFKAVFQPQNMLKGFAGRAKREHPFHFRSQRVQRDSIRVEAGGAYTLERTPQDVALTSSLGAYSLKYKREGDAVTITREVNLFPARIAPGDFATFVEFCEKVDSAERESLVFKKKGAAN